MQDQDVKMGHLGNVDRKYIKVWTDGNNLNEMELFTIPDTELLCYCYYILYFQLPYGCEN